MIPLRLELRNFMSYGDEPTALDLTGMHTLCLSGENGHGKSALLDAITWALWGESRAGKNRHDELVRIGADEMGVQFTFQMDSRTYRVLRKRSRKASGNQWELQQQDESGGWRALTGVNTTETGQVIQKLLRMSYDTFLNSAYLRQGQADQFVQQSPGKRKEILAEILDLSRYERLSEKARERMKIAQNEAVDLEREINLLDAELRQEDALRAQSDTLRQQKALLEARRDLLKTEWDALKDRKGHLEAQQRQADALAAQMAALDNDIAALTVDIARQTQELAQVQELVARKPHICADFTDWEAATRESERLQEGTLQLSRGRQKLFEAEKELLATRAELQSRWERADSECREAARRLEDLPLLLKDRAELRPKVAAAEVAETERAALLERLQDAEERFAGLREEDARLDYEVKQWQERIVSLEQQQGVCLVCNTPLPEPKVAATRQQYDAALQDAQARRGALKRDAKAVKEEVTALKAQVTEREQLVKSAQQHHVRAGQVEQRIYELETVQATLPTLEKQRQELTQTLEQEVYAPEVRARIARYQAGLAKLQGVEAEFEAVRARLASLAGADRRHLELTQAEAALPPRLERLARDQETLTRQRAARAEAEQHRQALGDARRELAALETRGLEIRQEAQQNQAENSRVEQEIGRCEHLLERCGQLKIQRIEKSGLMATAKKDQEAHDQLTKAFSKNGIQAVIIEGAIPELQEEANRL